MKEQDEERLRNDDVIPRHVTGITSSLRRLMLWTPENRPRQLTFGRIINPPSYNAVVFRLS